jgi:hypothetical protein
LSYFWAIVVASVLKRIKAIAIPKIFLFIGGCLSAEASDEA